MPIELMMIFASLLLLLVMTVLQASQNLKHNDFWELMGPRDNAVKPQGSLLGRIDRAIQNYKENLLYFLPLAMLAVALDVSNFYTAAGAELFVVSRVIYVPLYLTSIPGPRSMAWAGGIIGCFMIGCGLIAAF